MGKVFSHPRLAAAFRLGPLLPDRAPARSPNFPLHSTRGLFYACINVKRYQFTQSVNLSRKQFHFIQSLARGISVLQAFSAERPSLRLNDIAELTNMSPTAAQRFTDTLMQLGFLQRNRHREFRLTPKVLSLGFAFLNGSQLKQLARSFLDEFCQRHNRTTNLAILQGDQTVFLYRREAQRFLKFDLHAGSHLPSYATGSGKALLAGLPDEELRALIAGMDLAPITGHTNTDPAKLWEDLMETRRRGHAVCDRELNLGLYSLGAPVLDADGVTVAGINVSLSVEEARGAYLERMVASLLEMGRGLSEALGYAGPYPSFGAATRLGGQS